jgi:hypothetical protein
VEGGEGEPIIVNHQRSVIVKFINFVPSRLDSRFFRRLGASPLFSIVLFVFLTPKESSRRFISSSLSTHTSESSNFIIVATVSCHSLCSHSDLLHRLPGTQRQAGRQSQWARQRKRVKELNRSFHQKQCHRSFFASPTLYLLSRNWVMEKSQQESIHHPLTHFQPRP